uniref:Putative vacuole morphology and inheritance protein 14 n=1 Tax=Helianthus annuus TaxID=4232 RepID=A0A251T3I3_HELAN
MKSVTRTNLLSFVSLRSPASGAKPVNHDGNSDGVVARSRNRDGGALSAIPAAVLRNLSDKLYEKRNNVALEVEGIVKNLTAAGDHDKITAVIKLLTHEYTYSPQANHRKGGLIGLAAATVGLSSEAVQHLEVWINVFAVVFGMLYVHEYRV